MQRALRLQELKNFPVRHARNSGRVERTVQQPQRPSTPPPWRGRNRREGNGFRFCGTAPGGPRQIEDRLGLRALVSLSDRDDIEAGMHLRMLEGTASFPISVEWTVPFEDTEFHIGVHNLPAESAMAWMAELASFTANYDAEKLRGIPCGLSSEESVLVVLNRLYWDAESIGPERHKRALRSFMSKFLPGLHAIELNGMRSRRENRGALQLWAVLGIPVISGGDRHGCEANSVLNLSQARSFEEFVQEVREEKRSQIVLMPQ